MNHKIVITGGPASGKTEFIKRLKIIQEFKQFVFLEEQARHFLSKLPHLRNNKQELHKQIYQAQSALENKYADNNFITDRGTADILAYQPEIIALVGTTLQREYQRYDAVILLGSSATLGEKYFIGDAIRQESIIEALQIESALIKVWGNHPGYHFIEAERYFEKKFDNFLKIIKQIISKNSFK